MRSWYGPDETREPWCFLTLVSETNDQESTLTGWATGVGNSEQLLSTESKTLQTDCKELDLIITLGEILDTHRYTGVILITPGEMTLSHLRRRLIACNELHSPTLRGYNHVALNAVLERYFDITSVSKFNEQIGRSMLTGTEAAPATDGDPSGVIKQLWRTWTAIYRLVPTTACLGEPL